MHERQEEQTFADQTTYLQREEHVEKYEVNLEP